MLIGWFSVLYWNKMGRKLRGIFCLFQNPENWFFPRILLANFRVPWKYFCTDFLSHLAIVKPLKWRSWILYSYWLKFSRALSSRQIQGARWFDREMDRLSVEKTWLLNVLVSRHEIWSKINNLNAARADMPASLGIRKRWALTLFYVENIINSWVLGVWEM